MANPEAFEAWRRGEAQKLANGDADAVAQMEQMLMEDHIYRHPISNWQPAEGVTSYIKHWMGPFAYEDQIFRDVFQADSSTQQHEGATDLSDLELEPDEVCIIVAEDLPPEVQLLVDARRGTLAPDFRGHLENEGWTITTIEAGPDSLSALLETAWLGRAHGTWNLEAVMAKAEGKEYTKPEISREDLPEHAPFHIGQVGCGNFSQFSTRWHDRPIYVIAGDSADDFCLAMALDRGWSAGLWLPASLLDGELAAMTMRTLADVLHRLTRGPGTRQIKLVSMTLGREELEEVLRLIHKSIWSEELADIVKTGDATDISLPPTQQLLDRAYLSETRYEPFIGEVMAADLAPPLVPSAARSNDPHACQWQVEVAVVGHSVPSGTHLADQIRQSDPWGTARAARSGLVFQSHHRGFSPGGATLEQLLERPRPRTPDAPEIFRILLARRRLAPALSDKGKYATASIERWGGLEAVLKSLSDASTSAILHSYAVPKGISHPGISLSGRRFMTIYHMAEITGHDATQLIDTVDDLVERQVLRRGFALKCGRCDHASWYGLRDLDQVFTCHRCAQRQAITGRRWRDPVEQPNIYYDLDEVVFQTLVHDGAVNLLALGAIKRDSKDFLYTPEMEIVELGADAPLCEIDIWAVADGKITIGEAKRGDDLSSGGNATEADSRAGKLARIAEAVSADVVVLATAAAQWKESAVERVAAKLSQIPTRLELVTAVAPARLWETTGKPERKLV